MMGRRNRDQGKLFHEFRLEDRIPENHLLRRMNVFVTAALGDLHEDLVPFYSDIGRPSVDPKSSCQRPHSVPKQPISFTSDYRRPARHFSHLLTRASSTRRLPSSVRAPVERPP
jgi:hypothetical protein